jgi:hypothetical protein
MSIQERYAALLLPRVRGFFICWGISEGICENSSGIVSVGPNQEKIHYPRFPIDFFCNDFDRPQMF